jgi:hypothetical protein
MVFFTKVCASLLYLGVFALLGLSVFQFHRGYMGHIPGHSALPSDTPFWENLAFSCIASLLVGGLYLVWHLGQRILRSLYYRQRVTRTDSAVLYCVAEGSAEVKFEIRVAERPSSEPTLITPSRLWYYVYSVGWAMFCLAFSLPCAHFVSSLCLGASSLGCALWVVARDDELALVGSKRVLLALLGGLNLAAVGLCVYQYCTGGEGPGMLWRSLASEVVGPLLAPCWVAGCSSKARPLQVPSHHVVLFGLPFVCVLSGGFLSVYLPLQECHSPMMIMMMNSTTVMMPLLAETTIREQGPAELLLGLLVVPGLLYSAQVLYTGAFLRPENLLVCMNALWVVFVGRQAVLQGLLYGPALALSVLGWLLSVLYALVHVYQQEEHNSWQDIYGDI